MTTPENTVRDLSRKDYEAARKKAIRDEPRPEPAPCDRPLPSAAMEMTDEQYREAKRAIGARN